MNINPFGTLYIVATPIGNLRDITFRALDVLKTVDYIAVEDTRHSAGLLQHLSVNTSTIALHDFNERERSAKLLALLQQGKSIALISDAGTPLISDPGFFLVAQARALGIAVVPIPGPCAAISALCVSGLPTDRFSFEGFLPAKTALRMQQLQKLQHETRTMIFYEAPHRILECLQDMEKIFGPKREVTIAREMTKLFETIRSDPLHELIAWVLNDANQRRGEIVILVKGASEALAEENEDAYRILKILLSELPLKQAVELAAKISGGKKNELYKQALILRHS